MAQAQRLAILGCGNMGQAIAAALRRAVPAVEIVAYDPDDSRAASVAAPGQAARSSVAAVEGTEVVLLAVKPQVMGDLLPQLRPLAPGKLWVSIAAGITTRFLADRLPGGRIVRAMPNTPLLAGRGIVSLCPGPSASPSDLDQARGLFPGAMLLDVPEDLMDAVTAVSGSGPAYFFAFTEALAAAARQQGFDADTARRLAEGTFVGAAALLEQSADPAGVLRERVTSPGGTTQAALTALGEGNLDAIVSRAVAAAVQRGRELSGE